MNRQTLLFANQTFTPWNTESVLLLPGILRDVPSPLTNLRIGYKPFFQHFLRLKRPQSAVITVKNHPLMPSVALKTLAVRECNSVLRIIFRMNRSYTDEFAVRTYYTVTNNQFSVRFPTVSSENRRRIRKQLPMLRRAGNHQYIKGVSRLFFNEILHGFTDIAVEFGWNPPRIGVLTVGAVIRLN